MGRVSFMHQPHFRRWIRRGVLGLSVAALSVAVFRGSPVLAQTAGQPPAAAGSFQLPPVIVTAQKEAADLKNVPVSVTAVPGGVVRESGATIVSDVAILSPNTFFSEFSARKLSNARFRGIGSSPANPAVTTTLDGVPQLNANTSSVELLDVAQVEFVRGPQSTLYGRNTLGGVVAVTSTRPSLSSWTGGATVPLANRAARDVRATASGPLIDGRLGVGLALQYGERDGFTRNTVTGNDVDTRSAFNAKAQLLWTPSAQWETRVIVSGERARDGDYALSDLGGLRRNPFVTARDFEGHTDRDIRAATILARREGARVTLSSTTGFVSWATEDATDLDYSPLPLLRRDNREESRQFTQEVRLASANGAPVRLGGSASLRWQTGMFLFTQAYDQLAVNTFAPFVLSPLVPFAIRATSPEAALDDVGIGVYGQGVATLGEKVDLSLGLRFDHEEKDATLKTFYSLAIAPPQTVEAERGFSNVSPQAAVTVRLHPDANVFFSVARGYKAGGFNAASPATRQAYGEEQTWNIEGGTKASLAGDRVRIQASVFRLDWDDLQLNLPDPAVPGQFFIANVGGAASTGAELELQGRVRSGFDVFGMLGYTRARFSAGSVSSGVPVAGNDIPNTPDLTATIGTQLSRALAGGASLYGRAETTVNGGFSYDDLNTARQASFTLTNARVGVRGRLLFAEAWVRNAFDAKYIPVAFAYGQLAPSGFIGEMGRPRTFGVTSGVTF
jgi:iron complex outermembrane receptor protein